MLRIERLLGDASDTCWAERRHDPVAVGWAEATRRRLRVTSRDGVDVAIDVPRGTFLADGGVLDDDGSRIIVIERTRCPALVVRIGGSLPADVRLRAAVLLGHAFGNQHAPLEIIGDEVRVPLTTSAEIASATVAALRLQGVTSEVVELALARSAPLSGSDSGHSHGPSVEVPRAGGEDEAHAHRHHGHVHGS